MSAMPAPDPRLYAPPGDGEDAYTWAGERYIRVTSIVSQVSSEHLLAWYAKQACLRTVAPLVHAGLIPTDRDDALFQFVEGEPYRDLSATDAVLQAANWQFNMREGFRYRDHKGRIGTLVHRAKHAHALGTLPASDEDRLGWLIAESAKPGFIPEEVIERFAVFGKSPGEVHADLAYHAMPYLEGAIKYTDKLKPVYDAIGLESMVLSRSEEYAGTADGWAWHTREAWTAAGLNWPFPTKDRALLLEDYKTSNSLSQTVKQQLSAYMFADKLCLFATGEEFTLPTADGALVVHIKQRDFALQVWTREQLEDVYQRSFLPLLDHWRLENDKPRPLGSRALKMRAAPKPRRGEREVTF